MRRDMVKCRRGVAGARYAWARPRPPALEVKNPTQAEGLEKYKEMSILGLLCLLCALVAGLFLVLYGLQRRDLKSLELLSRQLQRIAIRGRVPGPGERRSRQT